MKFPRLARLRTFFESLWWHLQLHTIGVWRMGPLGYLRHRRNFERAIDQIVKRFDEDPDAFGGIVTPVPPEPPV